METKHTPGPWMVESMPSGAVTVTAGQFFIAGNESSHGLDPDNAKLIAAAPDLLADLIEAAKTLRRYETLHRAKGTDESTAKAEVNVELASRFESTIAKATA